MKTISVLPLRMLAVCAVAALPLSSMAGAGFYIGAEAGANWQQNQSSLAGATFKAGPVVGLTGGYAFEDGWRPELEVDLRRNKLDSLNGGLVDGYGKAWSAMGNLWYDFKTGSRFKPYLGGGIGYVRPSAHSYTNTAGNQFNGDDNVFGFQIGAGVGYDITRRLTASLDYRALRTTPADIFSPATGTSVDSRYGAQSLMVGLRYAFGEPAVAAPMRATSEPAVEPRPAPVAAAPVHAAPAPIDSDGDGVPDNLDKCPNTPHGFAVDANGCIIKQTIVLRGVNFESNSDRMTGPAGNTLDEVAAALKGQPGLNVEIHGYTDARGNVAYNLKLSKKRAEAVRSYLIGKGVAGRNLVAKGFGPAKPVAGNDTEAGRAENRRVEFVVLNAPSTVKVINEDSTAQSKSAAEANDKPAKKSKKHKKAAKP